MQSRHIVVALVALAIGLTGCSPPDAAAVQVDDRGLPQIINCGSSIDAVEVSDADTGRVIWAARYSEPGDGSETRATISLGELPGSSWEEQAQLAVDPRPTTWQFDVSTTRDTVIAVSDDELRPGRVYRPDGTDESTSHYDEQTCTGIPVSRTTLRLGIAGVGVAGVVGCGIAAALQVRARRAARNGTPQQEHVAADRCS